MEKKRATASTNYSRLDIFDCQSIFELTDFCRNYVAATAGPNESKPAPNFDYRTSFEILQKARQKLGFEPAQNTLAVVTLDFQSDGQARFLNALLRLNILVEAVDFRNATVTMPLSGDGEQKDRRITSLGPQIAYVLGLLAQRQSPEVIIVTRSFELFEPLQDFVRRGGKAAIAFFRRFLDPRFGITGLFDAGSPIPFVDLDQESEQILGFDISEIGSGRPSRAQGICGL